MLWVNQTHPEPVNQAPGASQPKTPGASQPKTPGASQRTTKHPEPVNEAPGGRSQSTKHPEQSTNHPEPAQMAPTRPNPPEAPGNNPPRSAKRASVCAMTYVAARATTGTRPAESRCPRSTAARLRWQQVAVTRDITTGTGTAYMCTLYRRLARHTAGTRPPANCEATGPHRRTGITREGVQRETSKAATSNGRRRKGHLFLGYLST